MFICWYYTSATTRKNTFKIPCTNTEKMCISTLKCNVGNPIKFYRYNIFAFNICCSMQITLLKFIPNKTIFTNSSDFLYYLRITFFLQMLLCDVAVNVTDVVEHRLVHIKASSEKLLSYSSFS